jgi:hypothetical protein
MDTTESTLRLLDARLAALIRASSQQEDVLRRLACASASHALRVNKLDGGVLKDTLVRARARAAFPRNDTLQSLRERVSQVVDDMDDNAFRAQTAEDAGLGTREDYLIAFSAARAATSVLACLSESSLVAAAEACYEAAHAGTDADELVRICREVVGR